MHQTCLYYTWGSWHAIMLRFPLMCCKIKGICSALSAFEQRGIFIVLQPLWKLMWLLHLNHSSDLLIWVFDRRRLSCVSLEYFSLIWRRHHCQWRDADFDSLYSALMAIEQRLLGFSVPYVLWNGATASGGLVIHLFPSVLQWSCHYVFLRLRSVVAEIRTLSLPLARRTL